MSKYAFSAFCNKKVIKSSLPYGHYSSCLFPIGLFAEIIEPGDRHIKI